MYPMVTNSTAAEPDVIMSDLGPLAWVLDELRKSLETASKALKRFTGDVELARGSDLAAIDASQLRIARQQLHQAVGALEMVGLLEPALMLRSMETAVQKFVQQPELCTQDAVAKIEYASFALAEYLEGVLADKPVSAVSLFPQYRDVQELVRADRVHPADLWPYEWQWLEPQLSVMPPARHYDGPARAILDQSVLQLMKGKAPEAARSLRDLSLEFAAGETERQAKIFWLIAAGYFEAVAHNLLGSDLYVRRSASRILLQYAALSKGDASISERLALDLLFFCAQAVANRASDTPILSAVRFAYGLARFKPVDYERVQFGRFDPALLAQARKRIVSAKDAWSSLCAGESNKIKLVADQFSLVTDSLRKLHAASEPLAQALTAAIEATVRANQTPPISLAMEVATSVLYLEAVFDDLDPADPQLAVRTASLAKRLNGVIKGGDPQALEGWMEELYRRVSDKQTMGSVVSELRISLAELEKSLDQFFRNPQDKKNLQLVPGQLAQMRGVLSVLGLDQASRAVLHMKSRVEHMLDTEIDEQQVHAAGTFEHLGNNLGVLGFLIDMLNYQPALTKKLFVYDEEKDELQLMMGRSSVSSDAASTVTVNNQLLLAEPTSAMPEAKEPEPYAMLGDTLEMPSAFENAFSPLDPQLARPELGKEDAPGENFAQPGELNALADLPVAAESLHALRAVPVELPGSMDFEEDDLRDIFLEEAREVAGNALDALVTLANNPEDTEQLTVLRRAFHTLKGSARMVGINEFGEASWAMEQLLNSWLADQKTASKEFRTLCLDVMSALGRWIDDIAASQDGIWSAVPFCRSAEALRMEGRYIALNLIGDAAEMPALAQAEAPEVLGQDEVDFDVHLFDSVLDAVQLAAAPSAVAAEKDDTANSDLEDLDFDSLFLLPSEGSLPDASESAPVIELPQSMPEPEPEPEPEVDALAANEASLQESEKIEEDAVKVIDGLRIGLPLYNVYLNEADEWSRRLVNEIAEWALESNQPVSASSVTFAHSLAGSSATVGFSDLSELSRVLEHALENARHRHDQGTVAYDPVFVEASEEIRHLLHQFAAGFLKKPQPGILERLAQLQFPDAGATVPYEAHDLDLDFAAELFSTVQDEPDSVFSLLPEDQAEPIAVPAVAQSPHTAHVPISAPAFTAVRVAPAAVSAPALQAYAHLHDDIDAVDVIDSDLFPIFEEECAELMPRLGLALRQWAQTPSAEGERLEVLRVLHTLKGSARLAGAMRLGEMAHRIESEIASIGSQTPAVQEFDFLMTRFDGMETAFEGLRHADAIASAIPPLVMEASPVPAIEQVVQDVNVLTLENDVEVFAHPANDRISVTTRTSANANARQIDIPGPQAMVMQPLRQAANATIRVRTQLLDRMVNQAGEVMISRSRLEAEVGQLRVSLNDMTGNLTRLRQQLRDIELQAETQMQSRLALAKEAQAGFDPLEFDRFTRVQELTRMMAESVNDVATVQRTLQRTIEATEDDLAAQGRQTRELQRDLLRTRMVEFESVSERLYRVVRQASKEAGKQVRLDLHGGNLEMDRGMLERMMPAFGHLLRNCVSHGIEDPQTRVAAGKDPVGLISIELRQEGNDVSLSLSDDGAGLNLARIREHGVKMGLVKPGQRIDDETAANLIFLPGFSTADAVTELAGRGIGMDVVRTEVIALGGRIQTSTVPGKSTHFNLVLPLTTAVTQVVMLRAGSMSVGVPANVVETVRRTSSDELQQAYRTGRLDVGGESVPFFWSGALLQASHFSADAQAKTSPVVIFRSAAQRIALHVDEVLGNREVVVKNLGPQLSGLPGLTGMSMLPSGAVVLIYNPVALAAVYGEQARAWSKERIEQGGAQISRRQSDNAIPVASEPQVPLVLVVDDSITVRRVTQRLLLRDGYRVAMAADGLQALERLQEEIPAVVLSDIEMPRMDGFDLARNIRADARMKNLPIIMITSRIAVKHNEHAVELGVNHYLGKPYSEDELLRLVRQYCTANAAVAA